MTNHPNRGVQPRPSIILRHASKRYPEAWRQFDQFRQDRGKQGLPDWPEWCYCPMAAAYAIVGGGNNLDRDPIEMFGVQILAALAPWRVTQGIYRFDATTVQSIVSTPITALPTSVLYRLPEWCVYIEATPGMRYEGNEIAGFFAHLEYDVNVHLPELRLLLDYTDESTMAISLHLDQPTLDLAIEASVAESKKQMERLGLTHLLDAEPMDYAKHVAEGITPILNMVLYLCTANVDFGGMDRPAMPKPVRTKKGWKMFPPDQPRVWDVGARIGAALRAAHLDRQVEAHGEIGSGRQSPRPHIRMAHWHTYLVGTGKTERIVKWLPPIPVNIEDGDIVPTIHKGGK